MRTVYAPKPGVIALNFMWLPTFIGFGNALKKEIELELKPKIEGLPFTEETLDKAHELVIDAILKRFPDRPGLRDYLDAIKFVEDG